MTARLGLSDNWYARWAERPDPPAVVLARAACRGLDPNLFFPVKGNNAAAAVAVCRDCPVRVECLAWAVESNEDQGVWGGASVKQRRALRRQWRQESVA